MKRQIISLVLLVAVFSQTPVYAAEKSKVGTAAIESTNAAVKWTAFAVSGSLIATVFGLIYKMASSDPNIFTHSHTHSSSN
jgi:hypothetical protein